MGQQSRIKRARRQEKTLTTTMQEAYRNALLPPMTTLSSGDVIRAGRRSGKSLLTHRLADELAAQYERRRQGLVSVRQNRDVVRDEEQ